MMSNIIDFQIFLFATLKELVGADTATLKLSFPTTISQIRTELTTHYPKLADALPSAIASVNYEFAQNDMLVQAEDEVAFFPPVSGGSCGFPEVVMLAEEPISLDDLAAQIVTPETGAVALFSGYVRGTTNLEEGIQKTDSLEYSAYAPMAILKMQQVISEIRQNWSGVQGIAVVQRIGHLEVSQPTILIACAAAHRGDGCFEAARYGIDRLKEIVPVWKKEIHSGSEKWVEGNYQPTSDDQLT